MAVTPAIIAAATVAQALDPCAALATLHELAAEPARAAKCREVADAAQAMGADPVEVVALAWGESKLNADAVSPTGVGGALQVSGVGCLAWMRAGSPGAYAGHPVRVVDGKPCDVVAAGVWQWMRRRAKAADVRGAACAYNAGACPRSVVSMCAPGDSSRVCRGWRWAGTVAGMVDRMRAAAATVTATRAPSAMPSRLESSLSERVGDAEGKSSRKRGQHGAAERP